MVLVAVAVGFAEALAISETATAMNSSARQTEQFML
jgi:hypothetical protein